jgi:hypothetical protein
MASFAEDEVPLKKRRRTIIGTHGEADAQVRRRPLLKIAVCYLV